MNEKPIPKLLRWAEEEKGQSISAGPLTLGEVAAAASLQEVQEKSSHKKPAPKRLDETLKSDSHDADAPLVH